MLGKDDAIADTKKNERGTQGFLPASSFKAGEIPMDSKNGFL